MDDVDGLDARQTGRTQLAAEDARAQVDAVGVHGVGAPPPAEQPEHHPQGDERDQARVRLLELFELIGTTDPRVGKTRRALASLLY